MIRFRLGQQWKHEPGERSPLDAFGLQLDGVDLLVGASEEPLLEVVPALIDAVAALQASEPTAEVSLHEAHFELCFARTGPTELELTVVSLARPARLVHPPLKLELPMLLEATAKCARQLLADVAQTSPGLLAPAQLRHLEQKARALERGAVAPQREADPAGWSWERFARTDGELGVKVRDPDGRTLAFHRRSKAPLPCLLCPGEVSLRGTAWRRTAPPLLTLLELSRQALAEGGETVTFETATFSSREIFSAGLEWGVAHTARNPALAKNPHLEALVDRCTEGLGALRPLSPGAPSGKPAGRSEPADPPLPVVGALRRLRFEPKWERSTEVGDHGRLLLTRRGPVVLSPHAAWAFDPRGKSLHRRVDTHGVAAGDDGTVLTANASRVMAFAPGSGEARWFRDHDGVAVGPRLYSAGGLRLTSLAGRGVIVFSASTGREAWRFDPPRTQRGHLAVVGDRVLLATDGGSLYGLELADGQARFRVRASLPFAGPAVPHGRRALGVLSRADRTVVFLTEIRPTRPEVSPGAVVWNWESNLSHPSVPVVARGITYVAGLREHRAVVIALGRNGVQRWEQAVPLLGARLSLVAHGRGVIASDARGAAAGVSADGQLEWVLGAAGDELADLPPPVLRRGVLLLAGEKIRAVDPRGGRVLAELQAGRGLLDLAADARLNVYALDDAGVLRAWKLSTTLAVV